MKNKLKKLNKKQIIALVFVVDIILMVLLNLALNTFENKALEVAETTDSSETSETTENTGGIVSENGEVLISDEDLKKAEKRSKVQKQLDLDFEYEKFEIIENFTSNTDLVVVYLENNEIISAISKYNNYTETYDLDYQQFLNEEVSTTIHKNMGFENYKANNRSSEEYLKDFKYFEFSEELLKSVQSSLEYDANSYWTDETDIAVGQVLSEKETEKWLNYYENKVLELNPNAYDETGGAIYKNIKGYKIDIDNDGLEDIVIKKQYINKEKHGLYILINNGNGGYSIDRLFGDRNNFGEIGFINYENENYIIQKEYQNGNYLGAYIFHYGVIDGMPTEDVVFLKAYNVGQKVVESWNEESFEIILDTIKLNAYIPNEHSKVTLGNGEEEVGFVEKVNEEGYEEYNERVYKSLGDYNNDGTDDVLDRQIDDVGKPNKYITSINGEYLGSLGLLENGEAFYNNANFLANTKYGNVLIKQNVKYETEDIEDTKETKEAEDTSTYYDVYEAILIQGDVNKLIGKVTTKDKYFYKVISPYDEEFLELFKNYDLSNNYVATYNESIFTELSGLEFSFSSGAGGWGSYLQIDENGNFKGYYVDGELGATGEQYPYGTSILSRFKGECEVKEKLDDYTYVLTVTNIEYFMPENSEYVQDKVKIVLSSPAGLGEDTEYILCLPGKDANELSEGVRGWTGLVEKEVSEDFILYNVSDEDAYVSYEIN